MLTVTPRVLKTVALQCSDSKYCLTPSTWGARTGWLGVKRQQLANFSSFYRLSVSFYLGHICSFSRQLQFSSSERLSRLPPIRILMPCQLHSLVLSTFCVCKLWWKSVLSIFFCNGIMVSLLCVYAKRTGWKISPRSKTVILTIKLKFNSNSATETKGQKLSCPLTWSQFLLSLRHSQSLRSYEINLKPHQLPKRPFLG